MKARDDLDRSAVNDIMESVKRKGEFTLPVSRSLCKADARSLIYSLVGDRLGTGDTLHLHEDARQVVLTLISALDTPFSPSYPLRITLSSPSIST
jgi:hypothetical protein